MSVFVQQRWPQSLRDQVDQVAGRRGRTQFTIAAVQAALQACRPPTAEEVIEELGGGPPLFFGPGRRVIKPEDCGTCKGRPGVICDICGNGMEDQQTEDVSLARRPTTVIDPVLKERPRTAETLAVLEADPGSLLQASPEEARRITEAAEHLPDGPRRFACGCVTQATSPKARCGRHNKGFA